ncbi:MAG: hypothetical protein FJ293_14385 [Planctomycetes bacterium]|nr:hypothetical protein [Planctomycetota bacterium]
MARRRRRRGGPLLLLLLLAGLYAVWRDRGPSDPPPSAAGSAVAAGDAIRPERPLAATVKRVVDGDTLVVVVPGSITPEEKVRLLRINTPERGRPGFERATAALIALVDGRAVELEFEDPAKPERDEYGRLLAYVHIDDRCANVELVRAGWSRFFTRYGKGRHAAAFAQAESAARSADTGLWRDGEWDAADRR